MNRLEFRLGLRRLVQARNRWSKQATRDRQRGPYSHSRQGSADSVYCVNSQLCLKIGRTLPTVIRAGCRLPAGKNERRVSQPVSHGEFHFVAWPDKQRFSGITLAESYRVDKESGSPRRAYASFYLPAEPDGP